jgi:hypothetical protein
MRGRTARHESASLDMARHKALHHPFRGRDVASLASCMLWHLVGLAPSAPVACGMLAGSIFGDVPRILSFAVLSISVPSAFSLGFLTRLFAGTGQSLALSLRHSLYGPHACSELGDDLVT